MMMMIFNAINDKEVSIQQQRQRQRQRQRLPKNCYFYSFFVVAIFYIFGFATNAAATDNIIIKNDGFSSNRRFLREVVEEDYVSYTVSSDQQKKKHLHRKLSTTTTTTTTTEEEYVVGGVFTYNIIPFQFPNTTQTEALLTVTEEWLKIDVLELLGGYSNVVSVNVQVGVGANNMKQIPNTNDLELNTRITIIFDNDGSGFIPGSLFEIYSLLNNVDLLLYMTKYLSKLDPSNPYWNSYQVKLSSSSTVPSVLPATAATTAATSQSQGSSNQSQQSQGSSNQSQQSQGQNQNQGQNQGQSSSQQQFMRSISGLLGFGFFAGYEPDDLPTSNDVEITLCSMIIDFMYDEMNKESEEMIVVPSNIYCTIDSVNGDTSNISGDDGVTVDITLEFVFQLQPSNYYGLLPSTGELYTFFSQRNLGYFIQNYLWTEIPNITYWYNTGQVSWKVG